MSLQCEGDGTVCSVCGHFDFLPLTCVRCHGTFCSEHINSHLVALTESVCVSPGVNNTVAVPLSTSSGGLLHRCALCGSGCSFLIPCFTCQRSFCTAHRFHIHEEETKKGIKGGMHSSLRTAVDGEVEDLSQLSLRYSPNSPLHLAPPAYRGSMLPASLLVCRANSGLDRGDEVYALGVLSIQGAAEMSVGQLVDRLKSAHPTLLSSLLKQPLYHVDGVDRVVLRAIPLSATVREALHVNRVVAFVMPQALMREADTTGCGGAQHEECIFSAATLESMLTERLFGPILRGNRRDTRLHAAAVSVRIQSKQVEATDSPHKVPEENKEDVAVSEATETKDSSSPCCPCVPGHLSASECVETGSTVPREQLPQEGAAPWPFRCPLSLDKFAFSYSRRNPRGLEALRGSGAGVSPIVVAVFVADLLASRAVPPFCIALSREWPLGKVFDRIVQVVDESAAFKRQVRWELFDMRTHMSLMVGSSTQKNTLQDGDVLFLGEQFPDVLRVEVVRLQRLEGRASAALKMRMMKTCDVM